MSRRRGLAHTALELLRAVGLDDAERHFRQYPHELSGGMLQRVMIAGALTVQPELLLCDEPTTALDVTTQAEILQILKRLQAEREMGVLFITHDLDLAAAVCDRVYVMYAGRIVESAAAARVLRCARRTPTPPACCRRLPTCPVRTAGWCPIKGAPLSLLEAADRLLVHVALRVRRRGRLRRRGARSWSSTGGARGALPAVARSWRPSWPRSATGGGELDDATTCCSRSRTSARPTASARPSCRPSTGCRSPSGPGARSAWSASPARARPPRRGCWSGLELPDAGLDRRRRQGAGPAGAGERGPQGSGPRRPDRLPGPVPLAGPADQGQ